MRALNQKRTESIYKIDFYIPFDTIFPLRFFYLKVVVQLQLTQPVNNRLVIVQQQLFVVRMLRHDVIQSSRIRLHGKMNHARARERGKVSACVCLCVCEKEKEDERQSEKKISCKSCQMTVSKSQVQ